MKKRWIALLSAVALVLGIGVAVLPAVTPVVSAPAANAIPYAYLPGWGPHVQQSGTNLGTVQIANRTITCPKGNTGGSFAEGKGKYWRFVLCNNRTIYDLAGVATAPQVALVTGIVNVLPLARQGIWKCGFTYPWWLDPWGSAKLARVSTCWIEF